MDVRKQYKQANDEYEKVLDECSGIVDGTVLCDENYQSRLTNAWIVLQQASYDMSVADRYLEDELELEM